jgi:hypothetical protein
MLPDSMSSMMGYADPLKSRHDNVKGSISYSVNVDVVPPTTKANFMSFLKVNFWMFHLVCVAFFVGSTVLAIRMDFPYGGMNPQDFNCGDHSIVLIIVGVLLAARFASILWRRTFFQLVEVLFLLEFTLCVFTIMWWSYGLPLIVIGLGSVLLNQSIFQRFWYQKLLETVTHMDELVPKKPPSRSKDKTNLSTVPGYEEMTHMMGLNEKKAHDHNEHKSGHFQARSHKHKHLDALQRAYARSLGRDDIPASSTPTAAIGSEWDSIDKRVENTFIMCLDIIGGWANTVVWMGTCILLGLWLGETVKVTNWTTSNHMCLILTIVFGVAWLISVMRTYALLSHARGIPVAEKEWLTYDLATGSHSKHALALSSMDAQDGAFGEDHDESGKSNLVYCWKCAFDVARRTGCAYLGSICKNLAGQSREMIQDLTEFEYRRPLAAFWDITIDGVVTQVFVTLLFISASILFFGSPIFATQAPPNGAVLVIGLACIGSGFRKTLDVIGYTQTLAGGGDNDHRAMVVGESVLLIFVLFCLSGLAILLLVTMLSDNPPYAGLCQDSWNGYVNKLIPGACLRAGAN